MYMYSNPCQSVVDEMKILASKTTETKWWQKQSWIFI